VFSITHPHPSLPIETYGRGVTYGAQDIPIN
jgi:hypothetical protein